MAVVTARVAAACTEVLREVVAEVVAEENEAAVVVVSARELVLRAERDAVLVVV